MSHLDIIVKKKRERGFTEERKRNIQKLFSMSRRKGEREKKRYQLKQVFIKGMEEVIWNDWLNDCYLIWYDWPNSKTGYTQLRYCAYNEVLWNTENVLFLMSQRTRKQERERERERERDLFLIYGSDVVSWVLILLWLAFFQHRDIKIKWYLLVSDIS